MAAESHQRRTYLTDLECANCGTKLPADREQHLCAACGHPTRAIRPRRAPAPTYPAPASPLALGVTASGFTPKLLPLADQGESRHNWGGRYPAAGHATFKQRARYQALAQR